MTKKHFEALAKTVRLAVYLTDDQRKKLANDLAWELGQSNANFDKTRFIAACGVKGS